LFLEYLTYGGYPEVILLSEREKKKRKLEQLSLDYIKKDIYEANVQEVDKFFALLKILASQTGALVNVSDLSSALQLSQQTIEKYLYVMRKSYCISLVKPFWTNVKAELIKMPKVYFVDT
jgi:predicted AAA+ superfamily ATPase